MFMQLHSLVIQKSSTYANSESGADLQKFDLIPFFYSFTVYSIQFSSQDDAYCN